MTVKGLVVVVVHEVRGDVYGRVNLEEFLRLAALVAVGAADLDDLAQEFAAGEITLTLSPDEFRCRSSYDWYLGSYAAYRAWGAAQEVEPEEDRVTAQWHAIDMYRELIDDAARHMGEASGAWAVPMMVVPVASNRHLSVVR